MSSTNRGAERSAQDYYRTPIPAIVDFLKAFCEDFNKVNKLEILDPCAGGDHRHPMSYPTALVQHPIASDMSFFTIDIREDSRAIVQGDYLKTTIGNTPDIIISNPPFNLAIEFIQKALIDAKDGGLVIFLHRLNFFGSEKRKAWFQSMMPTYTYIHSKRMGFTDDGKTDSIEYAHSVWVKGRYPRFTKARVI